MYLDLTINIDNSSTTFRQDSYNKILTGIFFFWPNPVAYLELVLADRAGEELGPLWRLDRHCYTFFVCMVCIVVCVCVCVKGIQCVLCVQKAQYGLSAGSRGVVFAHNVHCTIIAQTYNYS